jgi:hypothetical protein
MDKNLKVSKVNFYTATRRNQNSRGPKRAFTPTIVYVTPKGETIAENLANRRQRPNTTYKKLLKAHGLDALNIPPGHKLAWNQSAGCECGCSPGFFITDSDGYRVTLFGLDSNGDRTIPLRALEVLVEEVTEEAPAPTDPQV